jgi:membrane associated rhomboid family serine protease
MSGVEPPAQGAETIPHCYRHPDRETYISCQRCGRPICPDCMRAATVGFHCPECVREGSATTRQARTAYGGRINTRATLLSGLIIGINAVMFVIANATAGPANTVGDFVQTMALIPSGGVTMTGEVVDGVAQGAYWQLVTSTFLHLGVFHLLMNMIGVWIFGTFLESVLGRWRFLALYLVTGFVGSVTVYLLADPHSMSLGASGSVFGLFGAALVILLKQGRDVSQLLVLLALNLFITFTVPRISWQAHLGGLLAGVLLGAAYAYAPRAQRTLVHAAVVLVMVGVAVAATVVRTNQLT